MIDINNLKCCVSHEEVMVEVFMEDPELAEMMLEDALAEGDLEEVRLVQRRMDEAKRRLAMPASA